MGSRALAAPRAARAAGRAAEPCAAADASIHTRAARDSYGRGNRYGHAHADRYSDLHAGPTNEYTDSYAYTASSARGGANCGG